MQDTLVEYKTAQLAKSVGFDWRTIPYYWDDKLWNDEIGKLGSYDECSTNPAPYVVYKEVIAAPTQSLVKKFLREEHRTDITVITDWTKTGRVYYVGLSYVNEKNEVDIWFSVDSDKYKIEYESYEEALEVGLVQGLKLIK